MLTDCRYALRRLAQSPIFALFAISTLGIGIGATTAAYSAVNAAMAPPGGVQHVETIVNIYHSPGGSPSFSGFSLPDYQNLRSRQTTFAEMAAWTFLPVSYAGNGTTDTSFGELVDGQYFRLLGVRAVRGRLIEPADDHPAVAPVAVISHSLWLRSYGGADNVIGQMIKVNGHAFEIVGVAAPEFKGLFNNGLVPSAMWLPLSSARDVYRKSPGVPFDPANREVRFLFAKGILKDGRTIAEAQAELGVIGQQLDAALPIGGDRDPRTSSSAERQRKWTARPMSDVRVNEASANFAEGLAAALMSAVFLVLLVACTNLANLVMARYSTRRRELAVRLALGSSRFRLVRESIIDVLMVAAAGGFAGLVIARALVVVLSNELRVAGTSTTLQITPSLDFGAFAVAIGTTMLTLVVATIAPIVHSSRADARAALVDGSQESTPRWRGRRVLLIVQTTVSVVLLTLAGLASTQIEAIEGADYGFAVQELALAEIDFESQNYGAVKAAAVTDEIRRQVAALPEIASVTIASGLPGGSIGHPGAMVSAPELPAPRFASVISGDERMIPTFGLRLIEGRSWTGRDAAMRPIVIDRFTARTLFGDAPAVGRTVPVRWGRDTEATLDMRTVIGVVGDAESPSRGRRYPLRIYTPSEAGSVSTVVVAARTIGPPDHLVPRLEQAIHGIDPDLVLRSVGTGASLVEANAQFFRIVGVIAAILGSFAWILALAGLYGVLSYLVTRRTREIGIRMALGATRREIVRMIVSQGLLPVAVGTVAGLGFGALARTALQSQFLRYAASYDLLLTVVVPAAFAAAAFLACYLPARRALAAEPLQALRQW